MDLHAVARAALDAVRPAADAKGVVLTSELEEGSQEFCGDPDRLQQVVGNLLANAVKFTPRDGRVEMRVQRARSEVEISVSDTGVGVAPDFLPHVFDRFRQADSSITRAQGGLGLGLAIVRHLVEVHGGTVHAESEGEGKGARFAVRMPVRAVAPQANAELAANGAPKDSATAVQADLQGLYVVVVDDDADARDLVAAVLANHGASVRTVSSVDEAVAQVRERRPDVLLSDIGLPSEDGYALIRRVRQIDAALPAAALTAYAGPEDHRRALAEGFNAHVTKPIEPADLALLVASLAGRTPPEMKPVEATAHAAAG
jgi:CheY-like chemotaxis protein/anti-sigma regulatory factor (Ser/Thr protein kinase)